ncbi:transmembrane prolyl 4-hydroxylase [Engraulis encrasicolus]|uniref:transmembrane prolyl 4-hydroxylase n=1 Tax=Engraulis encrasicolus TaxID=184585 RepID=UPI002FD5AFF7
MMEYEEDTLPDDACGDGHPLKLSPRPPPYRVNIQKSNVCSRAYFVVVMVFFHLYIINVIALLLYVHYNTGEVRSGEESATDTSSRNTHHPPLDPHPHHPSDSDLNLELSYRLPRLEGIRVGHVQRVSLVDDRAHEMRTLSLKPLLFEIPGFLSVEESSVVMQLAQLKGLTHSSPAGPLEGPDEQLSQDELFGLLDLNQDGLLQRDEILSLSHSPDTTFLNSRHLRELHTELEAKPSGVLSLEDFRRVTGSVLQKEGSAGSDAGDRWTQRRHKSTHARLHLGTGAHRTLQNIRTRVTRLSHLPSSLVELSEPLEVVRYELGGYSHAHYDSSSAHPDTSCAHTHLAANTSTLHQVPCRYMTVLLHLNAVESGGETSFPVADNRTYEEEALGDLAQQYCDKGNLKVKPAAGTALLWYNHLSDGYGWMGELDEFSLHGDCVVTRGPKWTGSVWVNLDPDQQRQAHYQRLVSRQPDSQTLHSRHSNHVHQDL